MSQNIPETVEKTDTDLLIMALLLIVFPPLGVLLKSNGFTPPVFISFFLYFLFILPSYIFSVWYCFVQQRKDSILPLSSNDFHNNLALNSISASVSHKDIQVY
ncbi:YqaE/Pmp3 family membrane protein [Caenorhabditis elegans]|uniref:Transmembrane protein n=1 Tax=Caenorhabditis elegans TaxID=6239 RepID=G4SFM0_CAEEL|nr:Transmembrane protein [Caenorhabditis elegans]CCD70133.1 Transmembrane protein [Caenorhabditis elegans]|eukprot:NP_001249762.1 Uncharacterized protein CELE_W03G9.10 [Caenorhabditis elegans]